MTKPPISVSLDDARWLAVRSQLLGGSGNLPGGKEGVAEAIERLGYLQIDTISVVARAHHQTMWARRPDYDSTMLHQLLAVDRRVFEYWGHAASYLPMSDYRFYRPRMLRSPARARGLEWMERNGDIAEQVLRRIESEGPLASKDFAQPEGRKGGEWWDWKPTKMALEMLLAQGKLMIVERRNFQRIYDLTERILPSHVDDGVPTDEEVARFLIRRALRAYGVAREREIREHIHGGDRILIAQAIKELVEAGEVVGVTVEGCESPPTFALPGALNGAPAPPASEQCTLLCPFDNLITLRERAKWLFDFDYTLECYVPAPKRVHGYFVFPILLGNQLIGRLDPKADRKKKNLIIRKLRFEPSFDAIEDSLPPLAEEIVRFARFNECDTVVFETIHPAGHKRALRSLVRRAIARGIPS